MKVVPKFRAKLHYRKFNDKQAAIAGVELEKIANSRKFSDIPNEVIVERARDKSSPLHSLSIWEWDVKKAAYRDWLATAQFLKNAIEIHVEGTANKYAPATVAIQIEEDKTFRHLPMGVAVAEKDVRNQMIEDAIEALKSWKERYSILLNIRPVKEAYENLNDAIFRVKEVRKAV